MTTEPAPEPLSIELALADAIALIDDRTRYIEVNAHYRAGWIDALRAVQADPAIAAADTILRSLATPSSVTPDLRAALLDVRSFVAEEDAKPGAGLHFAVSQVRILDYIDRRIADLGLREDDPLASVTPSEPTQRDR